MVELSTDSQTYTLIKGSIYTANGMKEFAESLVICGNKIVHVGGVEESYGFLLNKNIDPNSKNLKVLQLEEDQICLPGFIDPHIHPFHGTLQTMGPLLQDCQSPEEVVNTIASFIAENPETEFIYGTGYKEEIFQPNLSFLDNISTEKPILIRRYDLHAICVNSKLMSIAGVTADTPCPQGGRIEINSNGELTGVFHDTAMEIIRKYVPKISREKKTEILKRGLKDLLKYGLVTFMDALVTEENILCYQDVYLSNDMSITKESESAFPRAALSLYKRVPSNDMIEEYKKLFSNYRKETWQPDFKYKVNTVKFFIDGVFESGTQFYSTNRDEKFEESYAHEDRCKMFQYLMENNIQIHCHCIGNIATKMTLDAIEDVLKLGISSSEQNYIAHLEVVDEIDLERMKKFNIAASYTSYWFMKETFSSKIEEIIGLENMKNNFYPINTSIEKGIRVCLNSDWPVSTQNPLESIEVALTHRALGLGDHHPSYNEKQIISIYDAVNAYTISPAKVLGLGDVSGSIEVGKFADIIVLDKDIFKIKPWHIHQTKVLLTMIDGIIVYEAK